MIARHSLTVRPSDMLLATVVGLGIGILDIGAVFLPASTIFATFAVVYSLTA